MLKVFCDACDRQVQDTTRVIRQMLEFKTVRVSVELRNQHEVALCDDCFEMAYRTGKRVDWK